MKKLLILSLVAVLLAWPVVSLAATFKAGDSYSLPRGQMVSDDLYVGSGTITVSGNVAGDLFAAGGQISVTGTIAEDVSLAGGSINLAGPVGGDARVAGGDVTFDTTVGDDLFIAGGQVYITPDAVVGGDLVAAGGQVTIDGRVNGDVNVSSGQVTIGDTAVITGNLIYKSGHEAQIAPGARIAGTTSFNRIERFDRENFFGPMIVFSLIAKMLWFAVTAIILVLIFRTKAPRVVHQALDNFWPNALRGFLVLIAVPVALILLSITVVGIPVAGVLLLGYIAWMIIASVGSGIVFGAWLAKVLMKKNPAPVNWKVALGGIVALFFVQLVPLVGWIVCFIFFIVTLGAIAKTWYDTAWANR